MLDSEEAVCSMFAGRDLQQQDEREYSLHILHNNCDDAASDVSSVKTTRARELAPSAKGQCAKLFEDAMNSSDPMTLSAIFSSFMDPACYMDAYRVESPGCLDSEETLEVRVIGLKNLIAYFGAYVVAIPDSIFLVHEWHVFERRSGSCVVFRYSMSGNQIIPHDQRCNIKEVASVPIQALAGRKRKVETTHSIKFKDTLRGHSTLSEQQRRQRIRTLGEFIADNRSLPQHRPEVSQMQKDVNQEAWPCGMQPSEGKILLPIPMGGTDLPSSSSLSRSTNESPTMSDNNGDAMNDDGAGDGDGDGDVDAITVESSVSSSGPVPEWEGKVTNFPVVLLLPNAVSINIRGVMRFHLSEDGYVKRIHCSHFGKFNN